MHVHLSFYWHAHHAYDMRFILLATLQPSSPMSLSLIEIDHFRRGKAALLHIVQISSVDHQLAVMP